MIKKHKEKLAYFYKEVTTATSDTAESKKGGIKLGFEVWMAMCKGDLWFKQEWGGTEFHWIPQKANPNDAESGLGDGALCGEVSVTRTSDITGDERCKVKYQCRLSLLEAKMAFFNSQKMEEMSAGDAADSDF